MVVLDLSDLGLVFLYILFQTADLVLEFAGLLASLCSGLDGKFAILLFLGFGSILLRFRLLALFLRLQRVLNGFLLGDVFDANFFCLTS